MSNQGLNSSGIKAEFHLWRDQEYQVSCPEAPPHCLCLVHSALKPPQISHNFITSSGRACQEIKQLL